MKNWDDSNEWDVNPDVIKKEERRLFEKFEEYINLADKEITKKTLERKNKHCRSSRNKFALLALFGGTILVGLTVAFLFLWFNQ